MSALLPHPVNHDTDNGRFRLTDRTRIACVGLFSPGVYATACALRDGLAARCGLLLEVAAAGTSEGGILLGTLDDETVRDALGKAGAADLCDAALGREGYAIRVTPDGAVIAGADADGLFYGTHTFRQMLTSSADGPALPCGSTTDRPAHPFRGVHLYVPPKTEIEYLKRLIEYLAACKMNSIVLEMAAAVELKRHPEMNKAWERYAEKARRFPGRQGLLQSYNTLHGRGKDSNHFEQGGGTCISQDDLRDILRCARRNHVRIIPEIQSPGHAYWMCLAHPEVAEWQGDKYPDTFCPSNPRSYELLFDVMDELIDLMEPEWVSTGNDEYYFYAICPKCRDREGGDILADHLNKVNAFLRARGVRHMMWADKLINPDETERPTSPEYGTKKPIKWGGGVRVLDDAAGQYIQKATWQAIDRIPDDILMMDWYYGLAPDTEKYFARHGKTVVWGNFNPFRFCRNPERLYGPNVRGGELSTWIENGQLAHAHHNFPLMATVTADMLWRRVDADTEPRTRMSDFAAFWRDHRDMLNSAEFKLPTRGEAPCEFVPLELPADAGGVTDVDIAAVKAAAEDYLVPFQIADQPVVIAAGSEGSYTISVERQLRSIVFLCGLTLRAEELALAPLWDYGQYSEYFRSVEAGAMKFRGEFPVKNPRHPGHEGRVPMRLGLELGSLIEPYGEAWVSRPTFCDALLMPDGRAVFAWEWVNPNPENVLLHDIALMRGRGDVPADIVVFAATAVL